MTQLLCLSVALFAGLMMTRVCKPLGLPAVTGYLVAGILVGPYCLGLLGVDGLGFVSAESVQSFSIVSEAALGFIAFTIGNEFRMSQIRQIGRQALVVGLFEALTASVFVAGALVGLHFIIPDVLSLPVALTLGAIAAATAPAATLMVVRQYKASGPVTKILLPIVALDDAIGLMVFAVSFGAARAINEGHIDLLSVIAQPIAEIVLSLILGAVFGVLLSYTERLFHSRSKRLSITVAYVILAVALSQLEFYVGPVKIGFSSLLVCMMLGTVFCNMCDFSAELMDRIDRWTAPLFALFFVISGAGLEFSIFSKWTMVAVGLVYVVIRCLGKYTGASVGSRLMGCDPNVVKYLGVTLFPQAGVALGMTLVAASQLGGEQGAVIRNITLFSVMIYELVGPLLTKISLTRAGEIKKEERKSSRGVV